MNCCFLYIADKDDWKVKTMHDYECIDMIIRTSQAPLSHDVNYDLSSTGRPPTMSLLQTDMVVCAGIMWCRGR